MINWLTERRKRRQNEKQTTRTKPARPPEPPLASLIPDEIYGGMAERFARNLIAEAEQAAPASVRPSYNSHSSHSSHDSSSFDSSTDSGGW